ncbi:HD domain-containing protein [Mesorhizobium sp. B4-1-1]|uniref:HD domain-containing protein n=1 Tax=Mesorhizobium sp. B4-1-1 TaxID=2589890 RepID=UPI00112B3BFC|nr:HD domain-containing protein [Mesorhizobium sp. B4-1-1]TPI13566.1 HD domain-containing protein [Mesorhizobium sp. B4-1-1]
METREFEIRDPIHGMIPFSSLERDLINSNEFQRLRRIRQLSWTDYVYPGAMHTRFQHTLGVMHTASRAFDALVTDKSSKDILQSAFGLTDGVAERQRIIIRLAALVHDLGHSPFSHAGEGLFPVKRSAKGGDKAVLFQHEEYSSKIFEYLIFPLIKNHKDIASRSITLPEITGLIEKSPPNPMGALCKDIISGRMDADRMDYLLRDSYYCGVRYGHYEFDRLLNTICICEDPEDGSLSVGIKEDGLHSVEGLLIARYMMFHNVYFHKTRVIYDFHYQNALAEMLSKKGCFPRPTSQADIQKYVKWDDWKVQGLLSNGGGGEHGEMLRTRNHYRLVYHTSESFENEELAAKAFDRFDRVRAEVDSTRSYVWEENKSFAADIPVRVENGGLVTTRPLLELSGVVKSLRPLNQKRLYVASSAAESLRAKIPSIVLQG